MSDEIKIPSSKDTEEIILNIEGILSNLKPILKEDVYKVLLDAFNDIKNDQGNNTIAEDSARFLQKEMPGMWEQLMTISGSSTRDKLKQFQVSTLESYEKYYSFQQKLIEFKRILRECNPNYENQRAKIIVKALEILSLLDRLSFGLAPKLIEEANQLIYESLILTDDDQILQEIENNHFVKESIGRKIQPYISAPSRSIDYDFLDHESIQEVQTKSHYFSEMIRKNKDGYNDKQIAQTRIQRQTDEKIHNLNILMDSHDENIKHYKLKKYKIAFKNAIIASILPLGILYGYWTGKNISDNNPLYETETQIVDLSDDTPVVLEKYSEYDQTKTEYVSTVTIASPWRQTLSGGDLYTRDVNVYSFTKPEGSSDDYTLKKEDLTEENLSLKYHYSETTTNKNPSEQEEITVTETWQNKSHSQKNEEPIAAGLGWGLFGGIFGLAGGIFLNKKLQDSGYISSDTILECNRQIKDLIEKKKSLNEEIQSVSKEYSQEEEDIDYVSLLTSHSTESGKVLEKK